MAGFSELIRNFDKTRGYVRDFFIYGCKVRNDFDRKSSRTYDDEKRRVESWLNGHIKYDDSVRGRSVSISVDSGHIHENPLYSAYYSKSFTDNDFVLHFLIIDILQDGKTRTLKEITDILTDEYSRIFDEQTVRGKLREYTSEGLIISEKHGKTLYYSLSPDRTDELLGEFKGLDDCIKFFSETQYFGVVGNSILKAADIKNDIFLIKHNYIIHTLEDILIPEIIDAADSGSYIAITTFSGRNTSAPEKTVTAVPMRILVSVQTGRRYLAAYVPEMKRFTSFRLDYIRKTAKGDVCPYYNELKEKFTEDLKKCFGVSFGGGIAGTSQMKITFFADEENEKYIIERLEREKRCCTLEKTGKDLFTLTADVSDPNEMMQWLKTFIGRIVNIEGGSKNITDRFYSDILRMNEMYGGGNEPVQ